MTYIQILSATENSLPLLVPHTLSAAQPKLSINFPVIYEILRTHPPDNTPDSAGLYQDHMYYRTAIALKKPQKFRKIHAFTAVMTPTLVLNRSGCSVRTRWRSKAPRQSHRRHPAAPESPLIPGSTVSPAASVPWTPGRCPSATS